MVSNMKVTLTTNKEQRRFLSSQIERLQSAYRFCNSGVLKARMLPKALVAAQRRIERWERQDARRRELLRKRISALLDEARRSVLFDSPKVAMRTVQMTEKHIKRVVYGR